MQRGVHAILYAFFYADERLDRAAMRKQVELCTGAGVAGIAAPGLATEVAKLSFVERETLMDWVAEDTGGRLPLGFTIYGQSVAEQVAMVRRAEGCGAQWLILQPPQAGTYDAAEYLSFFGRVMSSTALPCAIQNAPQYLGCGLSHEDIDSLRRRHANFTLIKAEASAEDAARLKALAGAQFRVFNGRGGLEMTACLDRGCDGFLLAPDLADIGVRVMRLHDEGNRGEAARLHAGALPAIHFVMRSIEHLICYGKRLFAARAGLRVFDRAPALRPSPEGLAELDALLKGLPAFPLPQGEACRGIGGADVALGVIDQLRHCIACALCVTAADAGEDVRMSGNRIGKRQAAELLAAAAGVEAFPQGACHGLEQVGEHAIAAGQCQRLMEIGIGLVEADLRCGIALGSHRFRRGAHAGECRLGGHDPGAARLARRHHCGLDLERTPHLDEVEQAFRVRLDEGGEEVAEYGSVRLADDGAPPARHVEQAAAREHLHGFAHRDAAHAITLRQFRLARAGYYIYTPDDQPLIGPVSEVKGFHLNCGYWAGVMLSPEAGRRVAQLVTGQMKPQDNPLRLSRFAEGAVSTGDSFLRGRH